MAESVRVSKAGAYAELGDEAVLVSKAGAYAELGDEAVLISKFGVYVEIDSGTTRVSKAGAYAEILPPPPPYVRVVDGLGVWYNDILLDSYIQQFTLEAAIKADDTSNLVTAGTQQPNLPSWSATMHGAWSKALDDIFGAEVVGRGSSSTLYNFRVLLGVWNGLVLYRWVANAFVSTYKTHMNIDEIMVFDATIALSGSPERGSST